MTRATEKLRDAQRAHPPAQEWSGLPDILWDALSDRIPSHLHDLRADGRLAIGVTSEPHHRISVSFEDDDSFALLIRQDLMALIYRVLRVIVASTGLTDGRETSPAGY